MPGGEGGSTASAPPTAEVAAEVKQPDPQQPAAAKKHLSLQDKQLLELQKRQNQFKSAALTAKKSGQMEQAKEYLRQAKGFDNLIDAAKSGLPVDFKTLPVAPQAVKGELFFPKESWGPKTKFCLQFDLFLFEVRLLYSKLDYFANEKPRVKIIHRAVVLVFAFLRIFKSIRLPQYSVVLIRFHL